MKKQLKKIIGMLDCKLLSCILYRKQFNKKLDLKQPLDFNEKLMWLKLTNYNKNRLVWECSDKYLVRKYLMRKGIEEENLPKILNVYDKAYEINFDELPNKFALKCTHGCGYNVICSDKKKLNNNQVIKQLSKWQKDKFGFESGENHYTHIKPKIICEEYIDSNIGYPFDYKIYCFYGNPKLVLVCSEREKELRLNFYDLKWNELMIGKEKYRNKKKILKPKNLDSMISMAKKVSNDFPFVRIDFYDNGKKAVIGELTFTPAACLATYYNEEGNKYLSSMLNINQNYEK